MSIHPVPASDPVQGVLGLLDLVTAAIRAPTEVRSAGANVEYEFVPDLTPADAALFADLASTARTRVLTPADYAAIKARLEIGRTFVSQTRGDFMAKTAADRDREAFDAMEALWRVIFRLLRVIG